MFDLGMQELIVIFVVALIVFGPKRLPELGRTIGKGLGEIKKAMQGVKEQVDAEMREINKPVNDLKKPLSFDMELHKKAEALAKRDAEEAAAKDQPKAEGPQMEQTITGLSKQPANSPKEEAALENQGEAEKPQIEQTVTGQSKKPVTPPKEEEESGKEAEQGPGAA